MSPRIKYVLLTVIAALIVIIGLLFTLRAPPAFPEEPSLTPAARYFITQTQAKIVQELGQPIEGFEQSMFHRVYPGLIVQDFENVQTYGDTRPPNMRSSIDDAITTQGMGTLLENIAWRASLPMQTQADVDTVIAFMESAPGNDPTAVEPPARATLLGTFVCLPHVDPNGPQTDECAFGLKTDVGNYYALDFMLMSHTPPQIPLNARITASGVLIPIERLSTDHWRQYPIQFIFSVTDSVRVKE